MRPDLSARGSRAASSSAHTTCRRRRARRTRTRAGRGAGCGAGGAGRQRAARSAAAQLRPTARHPTIKWVGTRQPVWPTSNANGYHTYGKPVVVVGPGVGKEAWTGDHAETWQTRVREPLDVRQRHHEERRAGTGRTRRPATSTRRRSSRTSRSKRNCSWTRVRTAASTSAGATSCSCQVGQGATGRWDHRGPSEPRRDLRLEGAPTSTPASRPASGRSSRPSSSATASSVWLNDIRIHDNAELPAFTGGALDNDELAPGPIMIQGDHSRVTFRKLRRHADYEGRAAIDHRLRI